MSAIKELKIDTHEVQTINNRTTRHPPNRSTIFEQRSQKATFNILHGFLFVLKDLMFPLSPYGPHNAMWV